MNLITFGIILICFNIWTVESRVLSQFGSIVGFLEKFKTKLKNGDDKLGLPVLDPFDADRLEIKLNEEMINMDALLTKANAKGLSEYDIIKGEYDMGKIFVLNLHLSWPLIVASTDYSMKGKISDFEIYGKGDMKMSAHDFSFNTTMEFAIEGGLIGHLKITDIKLKLSLKSLDFHVTGLYDDDEMSSILSDLISDMAPDVISDDAVVNELIPFIRKPLDNFLASKTVLELLNLLS